jgi:uncharacterized membrane protein (DUF2068 family)
VPLSQEPPVLEESRCVSACAPVRQERAPTLIAIVLYKFAKGLLLLLAAVVFYTLSDGAFKGQPHPLLGEVQNFIGQISPQTFHLIALGGMLYGFFSFVEGFGLFIRAAWAGWMAIIESGLFVPIELFDLSRQFTAGMTAILVLNIAIFWYLLANRQRLFPAALAKAGSLPQATAPLN